MLGATNLRRFAPGLLFRNTRRLPSNGWLRPSCGVLVSGASSAEMATHAAKLASNMHLANAMLRKRCDCMKSLQ